MGCRSRRCTGPRSGPACPAVDRLRRCVPCGLLSLTLLVARIVADDPHDALAAHDLAVLAPDLDRRTYFHSLAPLYIRSARLRLRLDRKSTRLNSSHMSISYAVFCLKKKNDRI